MVQTACGRQCGSLEELRKAGLRVTSTPILKRLSSEWEAERVVLATYIHAIAQPLKERVDRTGGATNLDDFDMRESVLSMVAFCHLTLHMPCHFLQK